MTRGRARLKELDVIAERALERRCSWPPSLRWFVASVTRELRRTLDAAAEGVLARGRFFDRELEREHGRSSRPSPNVASSHGRVIAGARPGVLFARRFWVGMWTRELRCGGDRFQT